MRFSLSHEVKMGEVGFGHPCKSGGFRLRGQHRGQHRESPYRHVSLAEEPCEIDLAAVGEDVGMSARRALDVCAGCGGPFEGLTFDCKPCKDRARKRASLARR
jgi:hypothetical protein